MLASGSSYCSPLARLTLSGMLLCGHETVSTPFLVDSGVDDNFISQDLAQQAHLPVETLPKLKIILDLDMEVLAGIMHWTQTITLIVSGNHLERIRFFLTCSSSFPGVFRALWLARHNPQDAWETGELACGLPHQLSTFGGQPLFRGLGSCSGDPRPVPDPEGVP